MLRLTDAQTLELSHAIHGVGDLAALAAALTDLYARVQQAIDARRPRCDISGRCCRFEQFGHRLFITTAELAVFRQQFQDIESPPAADDPGGCPFQHRNLCGVHAIRPFGCRIFFCDPTAQDWQRDQYEQFHADLKSLHERFGIPYYYVEWREGLRAAGF